MYEGFHILSFLLGLPLGLVITGFILYFSWKKGKKERRFDERYVKIHQQARSISWLVTTITILIAWTIVIIIEKPGLAFFMITAIWVVHMFSYLIGAIIATSKNE